MILLDGDNYLVDISDTALNIINTIQNTDGVILTEAEVLYVWFIVDSLIAEGIWDKIKALYGFVGGTAATHKWNWKDMRDLDVAYRLSWIATITHSNLGITGDGSTGCANTFLNVYSNFTKNNISIGAYSSTSIPRTSVNIGAIETPSSLIRILPYQTNGSTIFDLISDLNAGRIQVNVNSGSGFRIGNSMGSNMNMYNNGDLLGNRAIPSSGDLPNSNIYILSQREGGMSLGLNSNNTIAFSYVSTGLTQQEAIILSNIITTAQRILNRA